MFNGKKIKKLEEELREMAFRADKLGARVRELESEKSPKVVVVPKISTTHYFMQGYLEDVSQKEVSISTEDAIALILRHLDLKFEHSPKAETPESFSLVSTKPEKKKRKAPMKRKPSIYKGTTVPVLGEKKS